MMLLYNNKQKELRIVSISFLVSTEPILIVVKEDETVAKGDDYVLKCYACEGRLPLVGSDSRFSLLYCPYTLQLKHSVNGENWFNLKLEMEGNKSLGLMVVHFSFWFSC
ncbi:unnamed protein product [Brassica rapa subsp. narinosa]